ncbi:hypothetical protein K7432_018614, partial [Basidiobolus ranarum]
MLLITATPFQNDFMDLYSYFCLLKVYQGTQRDFKQIVIEEKNANRLVEWVTQNIGHLVLRRVPESRLM